MPDTPSDTKTEPKSSEIYSERSVKMMRPSGRVIWSDEMMLAAMSLRRQGWSSSQIARDLGVSRNSVIGALNRIKCEDRVTPDLCLRQENMNGGAGPEWLVRGLEAQRAMALA